MWTSCAWARPARGLCLGFSRIHTHTWGEAHSSGSVTDDPPLRDALQCPGYRSSGLKEQDAGGGCPRSPGPARPQPSPPSVTSGAAASWDMHTLFSTLRVHCAVFRSCHPSPGSFGAWCHPSSRSPFGRYVSITLPRSSRV